MLYVECQCLTGLVWRRADAPGVFNTLPVAFGKANEAASDQPGRAVVSDFLNKVLKLAALRIADICERLSFEPVDKNSITVQVPHSRSLPIHTTMTSRRKCLLRAVDSDISLMPVAIESLPVWQQTSCCLLSYTPMGGCHL